MGKKGRRSKKNQGENTYFKVFATFVCSSNSCNRSWNSAHGWEKDEELDTVCYSCQTPAKLTEVEDKMMDLDRYTCTCGAYWDQLHFGNATTEECECGRKLAPPAQPQSRFGRHYVFTCKTKSCEVKPVWEDFSIAQQKTQRCMTCHSRGDIKKIQKLNPLPRWLADKRRQQRGLDSDLKAGDGGGPGIVGFGMGKGPSTHNSNFCDMCQHMIRQGYRSCHGYRQVKTKTEPGGAGDEVEKIIAAFKS